MEGRRIIKFETFESSAEFEEWQSSNPNYIIFQLQPLIINSQMFDPANASLQLTMYKTGCMVFYTDSEKVK